MASHTYQLVRDAILNKRQVWGIYNGYARAMCPHTLGLSKKGEEQALFYQFGGESKSGLGSPGDPNNWRCVPLAGLSNVSVKDGAWHSAPNHTRPQTCVAQIDVEAAY